MPITVLNFKLLIPVLFLSLPFYFLAKFFEKKLQPRSSGKQFFLWLMAILVSAFLYFYVFGTLYIQFIHPRLFAN
jgi:polyferredoxin